MNFSVAFKIIGFLVGIETIFMIPSLLIGYFNKEASLSSFLITIGIMLVFAVFTKFITAKSRRLSPKDGLLIVSLGWIFAALFGALPLYLSKSVPTYIDAFFEIVSGFTTTGASIIPDISVLPKSIVLWRSVTHWIGGMGILVFTLSLLPKLGVGGFQIFKAETPGPVAGKIEPKMSETAKRLYIIYMGITIILITLLKIGGMTFFDSVVHAFGVVGTGGFSSYKDSLMSVNGAYIPIVMIIFMILCGTNFTMYYYLLKGKFKNIFIDEEFKCYYSIIATAIILIGIDLFVSGYASFGKSFLDSAFQVTSISSTSGFASADYDMWPVFSKFILYILFFIGSCAGSTAGGMKVIRIVVMAKLIRREIIKVIHPNAVEPIKINGRNLSDEVVFGIAAFMGVYIIVLVLGSAIVSLSGLDFVSATSSVMTMLSNVGPGFGKVGPTQNFLFFHSGYKLMFSFFMLLGRLEFFTLLALVAPERQ